jgi:hypothetical protein
LSDAADANYDGKRAQFARPRTRAALGGDGTAAADATAARPWGGALKRAGAGRRSTFEAAVGPLDPADPRFERAPGHA